MLGLSWLHFLVPWLAWPSRFGPGVPLRDYVVQSFEFLICGFGLAHVALSCWREARPLPSLLLGGLAAAFLANLALVAVGRGTLVAGFVLLVVGGGLVGFGTAYAGGCTSGHGVTGLAARQLPSLVAVIGFFAGGLVATHWLLPIVARLP